MVCRHLEAIRDATVGRRLIWLVLMDAEPVGLEVPASSMLDAALDHFVSGSGDLMLASPGAVDGVCVELNHLATGVEYEIVTWGRLSQ
jgi:hypothetical protein